MAMRFFLSLFFVIITFLSQTPFHTYGADLTHEQKEVLKYWEEFKGELENDPSGYKIARKIAEAMKLSGAEATREAIFNLYGDTLIRQDEINVSKKAVSESFVRGAKVGLNKIETLSVDDYNKYKIFLTDKQREAGDAYFLDGKPNTTSVISVIRGAIKKIQLQESVLMTENKNFLALLEDSKYPISENERRVAEAVFKNINPVNSQRPTLPEALKILNAGSSGPSLSFGVFKIHWYSFLEKVKAVSKVEITSTAEIMDQIVSRESLFKSILENRVYFSPMTERIALVADNGDGSFKSNIEIDKLLDLRSGAAADELAQARIKFLDLPEKIEQDRRDFGLLQRRDIPEVKKLDGWITLDKVLDVRYDASGKLIARTWVDVLRLLKENNPDRKINISAINLNQYFDNKLAYIRQTPSSLVDPSLPLLGALELESYKDPAYAFGPIQDRNSLVSNGFHLGGSVNLVKITDSSKNNQPSTDPLVEMREVLDVLHARYITEAKDLEKARTNANFLSQLGAENRMVSQAYAALARAQRGILKTTNEIYRINADLAFLNTIEEYSKLSPSSDEIRIKIGEDRKRIGDGMTLLGPEKRRLDDDLFGFKISDPIAWERSDNDRMEANIELSKLAAESRAIEKVQEKMNAGQRVSLPISTRFTLQAILEHPEWRPTYIKRLEGEYGITIMPSAPVAGDDIAIKNSAVAKPSGQRFLLQPDSTSGFSQENLFPSEKKLLDRAISQKPKPVAPQAGVNVAAYQKAMQEWSDSISKRNTAVKGAIPLEVTRIPSGGFKAQNIPLQKMASVARGLSYIPLPSTIKAFARSLWDSATGKTSEDYIDEYQVVRKSTLSELTDIDTSIESLRKGIDEIAFRNRNLSTKPEFDGRDNLQKQINALEKQRDALLTKIEELDSTISIEAVEGARRAMIEGMNKGYVDRVNPFES